MKLLELLENISLQVPIVSVIYAAVAGTFLALVNTNFIKMDFADAIQIVGITLVVLVVFFVLVEIILFILVTIRDASDSKRTNSTRSSYQGHYYPATTKESESGNEKKETDWVEKAFAVALLMEIHKVVEEENENWDEDE